MFTTEAQRHREIKGLKTPEPSPVIGAAIEVHRALGPGLLESAYEQCSVSGSSTSRRMSFRRQLDLPVIYKGVTLDCGYRIDLLVNEEVVVEIKSIESLLPVHEAQLTYLHAAA